MSSTAEKVEQQQGNGIEPDWKNIAIELAKRLGFVVNHFPPRASASLMNMETETTMSVLTWLADGLDMVPGIKVDREMLYLTPAQRRKAKRQKQKHSPATDHQQLET